MSTQLTVIEPLDPIRAIDRADHLQQSTKNQYKRALRLYLETGSKITDAEALARYALTL